MLTHTVFTPHSRLGVATHSISEKIEDGLQQWCIVINQEILTLPFFIYRWNTRSNPTNATTLSSLNKTSMGSRRVNSVEIN